jgi:hypothetical protein
MHAAAIVTDNGAEDFIRRLKEHPYVALHFDGHSA